MSANRSKSIHQYFCHFFENFNPAIDLRRWKSCTLDKCKCIQKFISKERIRMKSRSTLKIHHVNSGTYYTVYRLEKFIRNGKPKRGEQIFIKIASHLYSNGIKHLVLWLLLIYLFRFDFGFRGFYTRSVDLAFSAYDTMVFWSMSSNVCCNVNIYLENLREFIRFDDRYGLRLWFLIFICKWIHCSENDNNFFVSFVCYFIIPARNNNQNETSLDLDISI